MHTNQKKLLILGISLLLAATLLLGCRPQTVLPVNDISPAPTQAQTTKEPAPPTEKPKEKVTEPPPATVTSEPTELPVVHLTVPGELPAERENHAGDYNSADTAKRKQAPGGDKVSKNSYERPFNAFTMDTYYPFLDIVDSEAYMDDTWIYFVIHLQKSDESGGFRGKYGVELDLDIDGRGDTLVLVNAPASTDWSTTGVQIWNDANEDVGGIRALVVDAPNSGDGFETLVFDENNTDDPDMGWARIVTGDTFQVQLAFKKAVIEEDNKFLWGAWAGFDALNPGWFDHNDYFTKEDAGSSLTGYELFYPIKKLEAIDNTCRVAIGYQPTGTEPGLCTLPGQSDDSLPQTLQQSQGCVKPPNPNPQNGCWWWNKNACEWQCIN